jgi:hypothetical protein
VPCMASCCCDADDTESKAETAGDACSMHCHSTEGARSERASSGAHTEQHEAGEHRPSCESYVAFCGCPSHALRLNAVDPCPAKDVQSKIQIAHSEPSRLEPQNLADGPCCSESARGPGELDRPIYICFSTFRI